MQHTSDIMTTSLSSGDLRSRMMHRMATGHRVVWTPSDFADLANRSAVDKTLQRLEKSGNLRRIERGLYDQPIMNSLTKRLSVPDYREVIRAVTRRDNVRYLVDGMTAANELGLTTAIPDRIEVLTDARLKRIQLGHQQIHFKHAAPSRLYWADRPAMRVVQALHWLQNVLLKPDERTRVTKQLQSVLDDPAHGQTIRDDLRAGLSALPIWMQDFLRHLIGGKDTHP